MCYLAYDTECFRLKLMIIDLHYLLFSSNYLKKEKHD